MSAASLKALMSTTYCRARATVTPRRAICACLFSVSLRLAIAASPTPGGAADALSGRRTDRQPFWRDRLAAALAPPVGAGVDPPEGIIADSDLGMGSSSSAIAWARSNAIVAPSGSCSSSVAPTRAASMMTAMSRCRAAMRAAAATRSAVSRSRASCRALAPAAVRRARGVVTTTTAGSSRPRAPAAAWPRRGRRRPPGGRPLPQQVPALVERLLDLPQGSPVVVRPARRLCGAQLVLALDELVDLVVDVRVGLSSGCSRAVRADAGRHGRARARAGAR